MVPIAFGLVAGLFCSPAPPQELQPASLWADFNADGLPDVYLFGGAVPDALLLNDGAGGFPQQSCEAGLEGLVSRSVHLIDLDGDGALDLLRLTGEGAPRIHLGDGEGHFTPALGEGGLGSLTGLVDLRPADLDGDGDVDLSGISSLGEVVTLENTGDLVFASPRQLAPGRITIAPGAGGPVAPPEDPAAEAPVPNAGSSMPTPGFAPGGPVRIPSPMTGSVGSPAWSAPGTPTNAAPLESAAQTAAALLDQGVPGATLFASSLPTLGMLYPLSSDFYIDSNGNVGIGTTAVSSDVKLEVAGKTVFGTGNSAAGADSSIAGGSGNTVTASGGFIGAGQGNTAGGNSAVVSGTSNVAGGGTAFVGGGDQNQATGTFASIPGGNSNQATATYSTVSGGNSNTASGLYAAVPGGNANTAAGLGTFAGGQLAKANHDGSFVWADDNGGNPTSFATTAPDQFLVRATGGMGVGTDAPLGPLQVTDQSIALPSSAVTLDTVVVEDPNAILGLYSDSGGNYGSGIVLGEVVGGTLTDKWSIVRTTSGIGDLAFSFGTNPAYNTNPVLLSLTNTGTLVFGPSTAGNRLTLDNSGIVSPATITIDSLTTLRLKSGTDTLIQPTDQLIVGVDDFVVDIQSGQVGIGTLTPTFDLHVNGTAGKPGGGSWSTASDLRLKKNVHDLKGSLERLLDLRGVTFEYIDPEAIGELEGVRTGMIAQEVEQVFPDWVEPAEDGYLRLTFRGFEAEVVEALRELRREKDAQIEDLEQRLSRMEAMLELR